MHITRILAALLTGTLILPTSAADNMKLYGALVEEPCTIKPGDENIHLDFGTLVDKYLYTHQRTQSKAFQLQLLDCDTHLGKTVRISLSGTESLMLPGLLALDGGSQEQGVAIGFETSNGQSLKLNEWSPNNLLSNGKNIILLRAYVQGEPQAIAQRNIKQGIFTAIATFVLRYD